MGLDMRASEHESTAVDRAGRELARQVVRLKRKLAALVAAYPDRFVGLGNMTLQYPRAGRGADGRRHDQTGAAGFMMGGSVNGEELA